MCHRIGSGRVSVNLVLSDTRSRPNGWAKTHHPAPQMRKMANVGAKTGCFALGLRRKSGHGFGYSDIFLLFGNLSASAPYVFQRYHPVPTTVYSYFRMRCSDIVLARTQTQHTPPCEVGYVALGLTEDHFCDRGIGNVQRAHSVYIKIRGFVVKPLKLKD